MIERRWFPQTDLYGVTASEYSLGRSNQEVVQQMLEAGIKLIQYRDKEFTIRHKYDECLVIRKLCREYDACFIVNDDVHLALAVEADGIHVGQDDLPVVKVRELVGEKMLIGLSTSTPQQAAQAVNSGVVDYLGVGPIYDTSTKKEAGVPVGLDYLDYLVQRYRIPLVAIGGIKLSNVANVIRHGVTYVVMITDIVGADNIGQRIRAIRETISIAKASLKKPKQSMR
ncbi:thiamine phosphate synthase [Chloroflexota bacterium]